MKRKVLCALIALSMMAAMTGCGGANNENTQSEPETTVNEETTPEQETEETINQETEEQEAEVQEDPVVEEVSPIVEAINSAQVGDIIEIGSFEQDGEESNGAEPIEWQVLAEEDGKKLLLSKYVLMPVGNLMYDEFPGDGVNYTWAECGIRTYLNGEFYESAFTNEERELIAETEIRSTWQDPCSLGAELVDVETYSYESLGVTFSQEVGKIVTTDKIFIPDFDEDFAKYLKVERPSGFITYGTDQLAKSTVASGLPSFPYEQYGYDEAKEVCSGDVNLDESLIGEEFSSYIMRNGCSCQVSVYSDYDENGWGIGIPTDIKTTSFFVVHPEWAGSSSPYYLTELSPDLCANDIGIRPMMWVSAE